MNYNHDNLDLLEIRERGQTRHIPRGDYGDTGSTALARPIDVQRITQDAMASNTAMVTELLRQYATTAPADNRHPQVTGIASKDELASRNERFKWTTVAVIVLSSITAAGIVLVAQRQMELDTVAAIAGWLFLSGAGGYASALLVHRTESRLTPEALEMERVRGDYDVASVDAESRQIIARAFATSIENDSETKRANAEANRAQNMAWLESSKVRTAPQRAQPTRYEDSYRDYDESPQIAPESPTLATWDDDESEELIAAPTIAPDRDLIAMLAEIDRLYSDCDKRGSDIITIKLQWGDRGDWDVDVKEKAIRVLAYFDPPLIHRKNESGARWRLNRQAWRRPVARLIIAREWGN